MREVYAAVPPAELENGLHWYDMAHELARSVAELAGAELENAAACIAALSPRLDWESNARAALELARAGEWDAEVSIEGAGVKLRVRPYSGEATDRPTVARLVEVCHLEAFLEALEDN